MAFVKKTWKDRIVQYANRRLLTKSGGEVEQVTVTRDEGTISEAGDQFNASNMNDLEQRVKDGFDGLDASNIEYSSGVTIKQAIDSKQDTLGNTTGTFTGATNINIVRSALVKYGNIKILSVIFQPTGSVTNLGNVSSGFHPSYNIDFSAVSDNGYGARLRLVENTQTVVVANAAQIHINDYYAFTIAYI